MKYRLTLGPLLIAALVGLFILDHWLFTNVEGYPRSFPPPGFTALIVLAASLTANEVVNLFQRQGAAADRGIVLVSGWLMLAFTALSSSPPMTGLITGVMLGLAFLVVLAGLCGVWNPDVKAFSNGFAATLATTLYVFVPSAMMLAIRRRPDDGEALIIMLLLVCRMGDSGAYFIGRAFGRRKLIPHVSPGKTVAGAVGGLLTSAAFGYGCREAFEPLRETFSLWGVIGLSLAIGFVAQHGDLAASALKRGAGVKDSGKLFPEFGGALDLTDDFYLAAPLLFMALWMLP